MHLLAFMDFSTPDLLILAVLVVFIASIAVALRLARWWLKNFLDDYYDKRSGGGSKQG